MKASDLQIEFPDGYTKEISYHEIISIIKDIRYVRHELTNYSYLYAGQLSFNENLNRKYWEFLNLKGSIQDEHKEELEEGVLLIIYLLYMELYEAEGLSFLYQHDLFNAINEFINIYQTENLAFRKLKESILLLIDYSKQEKQNSQLIRKINGNNIWIYETFVENYFRNIADSFKPLKEKTDLIFNVIKKKKIRSNGG